MIKKMAEDEREVERVTEYVRRTDERLADRLEKNVLRAGGAGGRSEIAVAGGSSGSGGTQRERTERQEGGQQASKTVSGVGEASKVETGKVDEGMGVTEVLEEESDTKRRKEQTVVKGDRWLKKPPSAAMHIEEEMKLMVEKLGKRNDVSEVFSPPRIAAMAEAMGLRRMVLGYHNGG
jgi:hypothetical protein